MLSKDFKAPRLFRAHHGSSANILLPLLPKGGEGRGEEVVLSEFPGKPLTPALSPLVPRGAREKRHNVSRGTSEMRPVVSVLPVSLTFPPAGKLHQNSPLY